MGDRRLPGALAGLFASLASAAAFPAAAAAAHATDAAGAAATPVTSASSVSAFSRKHDFRPTCDDGGGAWGWSDHDASNADDDGDGDAVLPEPTRRGFVFVSDDDVEDEDDSDEDNFDNGDGRHPNTFKGTFDAADVATLSDQGDHIGSESEPGVGSDKTFLSHDDPLFAKDISTLHPSNVDDDDGRSTYSAATRSTQISLASTVVASSASSGRDGDNDSINACSTKPTLSSVPSSVPNTVAQAAAASESVTRIYYEVFGRGRKKIFLIIGLSATCQAWYPTVRRLLARDSDLQVLVLDNRGVGDSTTIGMPPFSVRTMARDCAAVLDQLGWSDDVALLGLSMGGMVAMELLLLDADRRARRARRDRASLPRSAAAAAAAAHLLPRATRFRAAVLLSTHAGRSVPPLPAVAQYVLGAGLGRVRGPPTDAQRIVAQLDLIYAPQWLARGGFSPRTGEFVTNRTRMLQAFQAIQAAKGQQPDSARLQQMRAIAGHHVSAERLARIGLLGIPVHVVTGTHDQLVRPANSWHLHRHVTGSRLTVVRAAGHGIKDEEPERLMQIMWETFYGAA
ncbi:hypothetical protein HK405_012067 [Cladochytrium tenue]|nr:hypothetical protein HK405_012067 [Cladochytrium tenue]